jgi:hypothetical protein
MRVPWQHTLLGLTDAVGRSSGVALRAIEAEAHVHRHRYSRRLVVGADRHKEGSDGVLHGDVMMKG